MRAKSSYPQVWITFVSSVDKFINTIKPRKKLWITFGENKKLSTDIPKNAVKCAKMRWISFSDANVKKVLQKILFCKK